MPTSVRLDPGTEVIVRRLSRRRGQAKSVVIREAIRALDAAEGGGKSVRPFALIEASVGIADSGGQQLSRQSGRKFRELLERRVRERRSR